MDIEIIKKAYKLSKVAHSGQKDRAGVDYFNGHILSVFNFVGGFNAKTTELAVVALLHDSVEDTNLKISDIRKLFGNVISDAVLAITKPKGFGSNESDYKRYLSTVKSNKIARLVKLADLKHNMDISRIQSPTKIDYIRIEKYKNAVKFLK